MPDLDGYVLKKIGGGLFPADIHGDDIIHSIADGAEVIVGIRQPRNPKFHRWFFALLRKVIENTDHRWKSEEHLLYALKLETGHFEPTQSLAGYVIVQPKSINFASMGEVGFKTFVARCLEAIHHNTGIDPDLLMEEVNREQGEI